MAEILLSDNFGQAIQSTIRKYNYRHNLESGSWGGDGSTACMIYGMDHLEDKSNLLLQCIEVNKERFDALVKNVSPWSYVIPYNMSSIRASDFLPRNFDEIWNSPYNKHKDAGQYPRAMVESWYYEDILKFQGEGFLTSAHRLENYDAVLIDGSEFAGYSEYQLLKDSTKCFMLDDTHKAYKCNQIYCTLKENKDWELLAEDPELRNGFAIFRRIRWS